MVNVPGSFSQYGIQYGHGKPSHALHYGSQQHYEHNPDFLYGNSPFSTGGPNFQEAMQPGRVHNRGFPPEFHRSFTALNFYRPAGSGFHSSSPYGKSRKRFRGHNGPPRNFVDDRPPRSNAASGAAGPSNAQKK
ncbi:hypothetical protein PtA15_2A646 [Puccinia triticina]|uniref:Uncharacterized protein n=1 Tax=Puccinia triticina TaxID=208348 RepID=A0ABY7CCB9_9BASI|nr:uncharacterized protein PtA15_2A646 [Puccinia triticina]WAQ82329.1 hypothetical protein PtA15_2A646 [Puccinia triticina]WAR53178.1 hypothetical protein PtB15_2B609 [Puccinia triticina]